MGPMVREKEAVRVDEWVREAVSAGARLVTGGERRGAIYTPTIVADVKPEMRISAEELFGPAVAVTPFDDIDQAIALANDSPYGLSAAIFTENLESAMKFAREVAVREPAHQLGTPVAGGPHAVRRAQGVADSGKRVHDTPSRR